MLIEELNRVGLQLNTTKSKILTSDEEAAPDSVSVGGNSVEVLKGFKTHKYLGRLLSGNSKGRVSVQYGHRIQCAWCKFHQYGHVLTNKQVSLRCRLKLFQSVVSSTILFGLSEVPLSQSQLTQLGALQRRMLRRIVGWSRIEGRVGAKRWSG